MNVPGLGRHLLSGGTAALKGTNTVIAKELYLDVGQFMIPLRKSTGCPTLVYLDLELAPRGNCQTEAAFPTRVTSGHTIPRGSALASRLLRSGAMGAASAFTATTSFVAPTTTPGLQTTTATATPVMPATAMAAAWANVWHQRLGHPNERTIQAARNIAETGVNFTDSLTACDICTINKGAKQPTRNKPGKTEITERLQLVSTDLLGPVTPAARGIYHFMAKYSNHFTKFKAVYFIPTKDMALTTLVKVVQDLVMPLGLRLQHLRADGGGEFIADYYRDYCETTAIIQQFSSPNTPEQNGLSERDGRTIMDVVRYLLNGAALPKSLSVEMAATAMVLLNRLPNKTIGGDTPYYRMFDKPTDQSFIRFFRACGFVHNEGHLRKSDPRAREGVLIDYDDDQPTYRIYFRETGQVTSTRNVAFIEVPPAAISTATGAEGRNDDDDDDDTLVYEDCNLDIIDDDTKD